jgi:hypothetical protein
MMIPKMKRMSEVRARGDWAYLAALLLAGCILVALPADSDPPGPISDEVIAGVNAHATHINSGRFLLRTETVLEQKGVLWEVLVEEVAFDGVRFRRDSSLELPAVADDYPEKQQRHLALFDGEKVITAVSPDLSPIVQAYPSRLEELPQWLTLPRGLIRPAIGAAAIHDEPLGDKLRASYAAHVAGEEDVGPDTCLRLVSQPISEGSNEVIYSWWVAPARDYAVVQYGRDVLFPASHDVALNRVVHTVEEWDRAADGFWLPRVTVRRAYVQRQAEEQPRLLQSETTAILSSVINTVIPDEVFSLPGQDEDDPAA